MPQYNDKYTLTQTFNVVKNDGEDFFQVVETYNNLDYVKLVQLEQIFVESINKAAKYGQQTAIALGANPKLFENN